MLDKHPLHALCPYFAMFPPEFARAQVARFTRPGDVVLDPFSGTRNDLTGGIAREQAHVGV